MRISTFKYAALLSLIYIMGCVKGDFDAPPSTLPEVSADKIITFDKMFEKLKASGITDIGEENYLEAVVVADDKSGNFYKNLILEDLKGDKGITISIDENELHALYPVGQKVYVNLTNLAIGYYEGLPTLGINEGSRVGRIPAGLLKATLINGGTTVTVTPNKVKLEDLGPQHYNTLIELEGMQFETATASTTYADANPTDPQSLNHNLQNCTGGKIVMRNSGFADFASQVVPSGNGKLVGVYSYYRSASQLFIRNVNDLTFTGDRCNGTGTGGITGTRASIESVRAQFTGTEKTLTTGFIQGIVISDITNKNINAQNIIVQDGDYGILCRFKSPVNIPLGTELKVGLTGGLLSEYNNLLQVQNLESTNVEVVASGKSVTPKVLTVAQIDITKHESTLIKIENATLSGGTKYADKIKVKDASGEIDLFTLSASTFGTTAVPSGTVAVVAIVSEFTSSKQLTIRNTGDVTGGQPCDPTVATADCDGDGVFSSQTKDMDIALSGWENVAVKGNRKWQAKLFDNNTYAQATAFGTTAPADMETWLVSPVVDTDVAANLSMETALQVWKHNGLSVWVTTNYTGDPATTSWQQVTGLKLATQGDADHAWIPSGTVNLKSYGKNLRIGFKYVGTQAANTTSYRIDNVKVN
ncbi:MAG: choice-of-anchor J domain-containing protein [Saprospiraceae bacterium]|nr:choice-of-anchor J domain-containing protein [Saprospiraceae bacterium]